MNNEVIDKNDKLMRKSITNSTNLIEKLLKNIGYKEYKCKQIVKIQKNKYGLIFYHHPSLSFYIRYRKTKLIYDLNFHQLKHSDLPYIEVDGRYVTIDILCGFVGLDSKLNTDGYVKITDEYLYHPNTNTINAQPYIFGDSLEKYRKFSECIFIHPIYKNYSVDILGNVYESIGNRNKKLELTCEKIMLRRILKNFHNEDYYETKFMNLFEFIYECFFNDILMTHSTRKFSRYRIIEKDTNTNIFLKNENSAFKFNKFNYCIINFSNLKIHPRFKNYAIDKHSDDWVATSAYSSSIYVKEDMKIRYLETNLPIIKIYDQFNKSFYQLYNKYQLIRECMIGRILNDNLFMINENLHSFDEEVIEVNFVKFFKSLIPTIYIDSSLTKIFIAKLGIVEEINENNEFIIDNQLVHVTKLIV